MSKENKKATEEKATLLDKNTDEVIVENSELNQSEEVVVDTAVEMAKTDYSSATSESQLVMDESEDSKEKLDAHSEIQEAIASGSVQGMTAAQTSVASQPMVPDLITGKPVYPTAEAAMLAQSALGKLSTPAPTEIPKEEE